MSMRKITAVLLTFLLLLSPVMLPVGPIRAETVQEDPAVLLMAAAHARISGKTDIDQLRGMKNAYGTYYNTLLQNPNLDENQKDQIAAIRDGKMAALDSRISNLENADKTIRRARGPFGLFGRFLRDVDRVVRRTGHAVGRGIVSAGKTVAHVIRDPRQLLQSAAILVASGGAASLKDAVVSVVRSRFSRELKKAAYSELAKMAFENPSLKKALELKEFLGIKGNDDLELALKEHYQRQSETEKEDDPEGIIDETGAEGDDGYDDPDNDARQLLETYARRNRSVKLIGDYTCTAVSIVPITDDHLAVIKESGLIWSGFADVAPNIAMSPEAVEGELGYYSQILGEAVAVSDSSLSLSANDGELEATLSFYFIPDLVEGKLEKIEEKQYRYVHQNETFLTESVSFPVDNLIPGLSYTSSRAYEQHEEPWSITLQVIFKLDDEGYLHADGSFKLDHYTSEVVSQYAYYYGYISSEYSFHFISEKSLE